MTDNIADAISRLTQAPLLSAADEADLLRRIAGGDEKARHQLIEANTRLVVDIARTFKSQMPQEDLVQEGIIGLVRATKRFNLKRGYRFSTYAAWLIRQTCEQAIEKYSRSIGLSTYFIETTNVVGENVVGEWVNPPVLSFERDGLDPDVTQFIQFMVDENNPDPAAVCIKAQTRQILAGAINTLKPREQTVLRMRFGFEGKPFTLQKIGDAIGLTREMARQIEIKACLRLLYNDALYFYLTDTEPIGFPARDARPAVRPKKKTYVPKKSAPSFALPAPPSLEPEPGQTPLQQLEMTRRAEERLLLLGYNTIEKAAHLTEAQLLNMPNFGAKTIAHFQQKIAAFYAQQAQSDALKPDTNAVDTNAVDTTNGAGYVSPPTVRETPSADSDYTPG